MAEPLNAAQDFDLEGFLPYLLNQAAEVTSQSFQTVYRRDHGMTRTQWRVLANLGKFGAMSATEICRISHMDKTKVSRAVAAMEAQGLLLRAPDKDDRRAEVLSLTTDGRRLFGALGAKAIAFDHDLRQRLGSEQAALLADALRRLIALQDGPGAAKDAL
ncbi:MarR Transcriptional regulators [Paracoccaceae bacterium]|jgi:DNA-binding MarR family transcriptional regulator